MDKKDKGKLSHLRGPTVLVTEKVVKGSRIGPRLVGIHL